MATYRIVKRNAIYRGAPGDEIVATPGRQLNAAIRAGIITRIDMEQPEPAPPVEKAPEPESEDTEPPKSKKRGRNG